MRVFTRWDVTSGKRLHEGKIVGDDSPFPAIWFLFPDAKLALQRIGPAALRLWDTETAQPLQHDVNGNPIRTFRHSARNGLLLAAQRNGSAYLWRLNGSRPYADSRQTNGLPVLNHSGTLAAYPKSPRTAVLRSTLAGGPADAELRTDFDIDALSFSPSDARIVALGSNALSVWDTQSLSPAGSLRWKPDGPDRHIETAVAFSDDGRTLVVTTRKGFRVWSIGAATSAEVVIEGSPLLLSPRGTYYVAETDSGINIVDTRTKRERPLKLKQGFGAPGRFTSDEHYLLLPLENGGAAIIDVATGVSTLIGTGEVDAIALNPSTDLAATHEGDQLRLWDWRKRELKGQLQFPTSVQDIEMNANGVMVATRSWIHWLKIGSSSFLGGTGHRLPAAWSGSYWLDPTRPIVRTIVSPADTQFLIASLALDRYTTAAVDGDPALLLQQWGAKLNLRLQAGEVVPNWQARSTSSRAETEVPTSRRP